MLCDNDLRKKTEILVKLLFSVHIIKLYVHDEFSYTFHKQTICWMELMYLKNYSYLSSERVLVKKPSKSLRKVLCGHFEKSWILSTVLVPIIIEITFKKEGRTFKGA